MSTSGEKKGLMGFHKGSRRAGDFWERKESVGGKGSKKNKPIKA